MNYNIFIRYSYHNMTEELEKDILPVKHLWPYMHTCDLLGLSHGGSDSDDNGGLLSNRIILLYYSFFSRFLPGT